MTLHRQPDDPGVDEPTLTLAEILAAQDASDRRIWRILWIMLAIGIAMLVYVASADAHDAPTGWSYPTSCCSGFDCREEADLAIRETTDGYLVVSTGEVIPYNDIRVRMSPDGRWHGCWRGAKFDAAPLICLFAPPRGF